MDDICVDFSCTCSWNFGFFFNRVTLLLQSRELHTLMVDSRKGAMLFSFLTTNFARVDVSTN